MHRVGAQIQRLARSLGFESSLRLSRIKGQWDDIFSGPVTLHAWPVNLKRSTLTIVVDSPAWLQQLSFLKDDLVAKLEGFGVKDIRFHTGRIPRKLPEKIVAIERDLTEEDRSFIENATSSVEDNALKDNIRSAIRAWAKHRPGQM
ncbi:MAG: DUF721 domain-containing protein [Thermodesulfovibrionales bacterium]|nr:DUF721 domain-containing protein [Thermodesulfovibrionales bacterium]